MSELIRPFQLAVPDEALDDLRRRLTHTRWPEKETVDDWRQGVPLAALQDLCDYWLREYDWRHCEAKLNGFGQYVTTIDGVDIHFIHRRSPNPDALPLIMTHGWPGSVIEFHKVIGPLADPAAHGGDPADAFHVVAPSIPGYGFSGKPREAGWTMQRIAAAWAELMRRLGYRRYVAQGGDWGSAISMAMGEAAPPELVAIHLNMVTTPPGRDQRDDMDEREKALLARARYYKDQGSGYAIQQSTRPQTLAYGLTDSPSGQAAWIYEKFLEWMDCDGDPLNVLTRDEILDNIMLYWLPGTAGSSARLYWESFRQFAASEVRTPMAASIFPKDISPPARRWAERRFSNIVYWNELDRGGHFAAFEQPQLFVEELRAALRSFR
ncbi:MAG: epoxide hydrolase [Burkholderiaceae bacterium]